MNGLLTELGKRLADRWMSLLVLPGALFLGVLAAAWQLGHTRWFGLDSLPGRLDQYRSTLTGSSATLFVTLLVFLLAAAACGLAVQALGSLVERLYLAADWPGWPKLVLPLVYRRIARRRQLYERRDADWGDARAAERLAGQTDRAAAVHRTAAARHQRLRVARDNVPPARPTWAGDRLHAVDTRLSGQLGIDATVVWPHLWLHVSDTTRCEITAARDAMMRASTLAGWGLLYLVVAAVWWPGILISFVVLGTARSRLRATTDAYATQVEAAIRLTARDLAQHLGLHDDGPFTQLHGTALTSYLTEGGNPAGSPLPPTG